MRAAPRKAKSGKDQPARSKRLRQILIGLACLVVLLLGTTYLLWPTSQVDQVRQMQQDLFSTPRDQMSDDERKQKWENVRAEMDKLSPEERIELKKEMGKQFMKKKNEESARYFAMSPQDRQKAIDQQIAREQQFMAKGGGGGPWGRGPGGNGPGGAGPGGQNGGGQAGPGGQGQGGQGQGGPGGRGPGGPPMTTEQRDDMMRSFLVNSTPQARAGMDQMRLDNAARRSELGLPSRGGRGFGP